MKAFTFSRLQKLYNFIPLTIFLYSYRYSVSWDKAFTIGGFIALLHILTFLFKSEVLNRFILAVDFFLIGGLLMVKGNISILEKIYSSYMQSVFPLALLVVGIVTTLFSSHRFIPEIRNPQKRIQYSLILIAITSGALIFSLQWVVNMFYAGFLPFIVPVLAEKFLIQQANL